MFERGKLILVPFPFTDFSSHKIRPALILSATKKESLDVIVVFITSKKQEKDPYAVLVSPTHIAQTGLKKDSWIRCDKIATLDKKIVLGEIGSLPKLQLKQVNKNLLSILGISKHL